MTYKLNYKAIFEDMQFQLVEQFKLEAPVHDADLRKSISSDVTGDKVTGAILNIYMISYWAPVEFGAIPHWTSVENLKKWCKDKWGDENLAYALQKHIAKFGTKPSGFIRKVLDEKLYDLFCDSIKRLGQDALIKI